MFSVSDKPDKTSSEVTWSFSTEYLNTSSALTFSTCELCSRKQPVQMVLRIIQHPNCGTKHSTEKVKSLHQCAEIVRAIVEENGNYGNMIAALSSSKSVNLILVVYHEIMFFRFPTLRRHILSNIPFTFRSTHKHFYTSHNGLQTVTVRAKSDCWSP